jgi:peptidoglycan/LPS O-acetylase OafA/YrhL
MLYHYFHGVNLFRAAKSFLLHGYIAVDLFFVLSGFVMALTYGRVFAGGFSFRKYLSFLFKRLGRLYPLYITVTSMMAALIYAGMISQAPPSAWTLISNILLIQAWGFANSIGGTSWSISTEFAAYLLFPVLLLVILVGRWTWTLIATVVAVTALALIATRTPADLHQIFEGTPIRNGPLDVFGTGTIYPLLRCLAGFTLGLLAFRIAQIPLAQRLASKRFTGDLVLAVVAVLMAIPKSDVFLVVLFVPLIVGLATEQSLAAKVLRSKVFYWLGLVSYSIYLLQFLVDDLLRNTITAGLNAMHVSHSISAAGILMVLLLFAFSTASYYGIEKPFRNLSRKLIRLRPATITSEPGAPHRPPNPNNS